jgi:hypothetical protein
MPTRLFGNLILIAAFGCLAQPSAAQENTKVSLRFLTFPKTAEPLEIQLRLADGKTMAISAPSNELSEPVSVTSPGEWSVGENVADAEGKPRFKEYGRTKAPAAPQQLLLLLRKGANPSDGIQLVALDGRLDAFGGGKFLFLNASTVDIAGVIGDRKFLVKPGQHTIVKPNADGGLAAASFYFRKDENPRAFFSSRWPVADHARGMVFFYHDPESKHVRLHSIRDFL